MDKGKKTFTKIWISRLLWFSCAWISCSYVLAFLDKGNIAIALSKVVVTVAIGGFLGYMCKSFFETKEAEKIKHKESEE